MLNNVQCTGNEARLLDCRLGLPVGCMSSEIAGVGCLPRTGKIDNGVRITIIVVTQGAGQWLFF